MLGTLCGGLALDAMGPSVRSALLICTAGVGAACTLIMAGFTLAQTLGWFAPAFAAGEFAMVSAGSCVGLRQAQHLGGKAGLPSTWRPGRLSCPPFASPQLVSHMPRRLLTPPLPPCRRQFLLAAPVNAALLWSVPPGLRPFTLSACEFAQHALGDIPSPPALGWLQVRGLPIQIR